MDSKHVYFTRGMSAEAELKLINAERESPMEVIIPKSEKTFGNKLFKDGLFDKTDYKIHKGFNILNCILNIEPFYNFLENLNLKYKKKILTDNKKMLKSLIGIIHENDLKNNINTIKSYCKEKEDKNDILSWYRFILSELNQEITSFLFFEEKVWQEVHENIKIINKNIFEYSPLVEIFHSGIKKEIGKNKVIKENIDVLELSSEEKNDIKSLLRENIINAHSEFKFYRTPMVMVFKLSGNVILKEVLKIEYEEYELRSFIYNEDDAFIKVDNIWRNIENNEEIEKDPNFRQVQPVMAFYVKKVQDKK